MKSVFSLLLILCCLSQTYAQYEIKSNKYKIGFTSDIKLEKYETEAETVLGYVDNQVDEKIAIDIEVFPLSNWNSTYKSSQQYAAIKTAELLGLTDVQAIGQKLPYIKNAYMILAADTDDAKTPVYVVAILNVKDRLVYEATIYCYEVSNAIGEKIAKSFKILD